MTERTVLMQQIKEHLNQNLLLEDPEVEVRVKRTSVGWLKLKIVTSCFEGKSLEEREIKIDEILEDIDFHLSKYPILSYDLWTPKEAKEQSQQYLQLQLPLWSDILMAAEPDRPVEVDEDTPNKKPFLVTFYSFRGGVGRSTALGLVAGILASKNRRIVIVDFDLEAPGISILLEPDLEKINEEQYGVLDYLYERHLNPEENFPEIENCVISANLSARGELFLVPVGEYDENYIHRLAEMDRGTLQAFYRREKNPVQQLIEDIKERLEPDVILIDARPGFNDTSAIALFDLADMGIACFSPTDQSLEGLRFVVEAVQKQRDYQGKPDLRFLVTPMPPVGGEQRQVWIDKVENWIEDHWGIPTGTTVGELYNLVNYNPSVAILSSLVNDVPKSLLDDYLPVAEIIDASLPEIKLRAESSIIDDRKTILNELHFVAATAQEIEAEKIPDIFQRTEDFPKFLSNKYWLIRGAKGTGKSLLFRLFVEQSEQAKKLADYYADINHVNFIAGHGKPELSKTILDGDDLASYEKQAGENAWRAFWRNYALLQLCHSQPGLGALLDRELVELSASEHPQYSAIVSWLVKRASPEAGSKAREELEGCDRWLQSNGRRVWLLYDELDAGFGFNQENYDRRKRALEALLAWWLESGTSFKSIVPKIFLREDIWDRLNFTNKGHYVGRSLQLRWDEADLWRLILRQALNNSDGLHQALNRELGLKVERKELDLVPLEQLRQALSVLWGERMGRGKAAYTYNWVRKRTADSQDNRFPRSLILLLEEAIKKEKDYSKEYTDERIIRPRALIDALPEVSKQRVAEVRNEYPELGELLDKLQNQRSPIDEERLAELWVKNGTELTNDIKSMLDAGIFKERSRPKDPPPRAYTVAELYLYGLDMVRKGQR